MRMAVGDSSSGADRRNRTKDVGIETGTRTAEQAVHVVELDAELQMLLDDILDGDWWRDQCTARLRIFGQQGLRVVLDQEQKDRALFLSFGR
jgi:hypothetical protein